MHRLPLELLREVVRYLDNRDRRALRLASTSCARIGLGCLLEEVRVEISNEGLAYLSVISQIPVFRRHVRSLVLVYPERPSPTGENIWLFCFVLEEGKAREITRKYSTLLDEDTTRSDQESKLHSGYSTFSDVARSETPSIPKLEPVRLSWKTLKAPSTPFPDSFYHNRPEHPLRRNFLRSLFPNFGSLERVFLDSNEQLFEWTLPKVSNKSHNCQVWMRSGKRTYTQPGLLRGIEFSLSQPVTSLRIGPDHREVLDHQDSFDAFISGTAEFKTNLRILEIKMPTVVFEPQHASRYRYGKGGTVHIHTLLLGMVIQVCKILAHTHKLEFLDLQFSYNFANLLKSRTDTYGFFPTGTPFVPLQDLFHYFTFAHLRQLKIASFSMTEQGFMDFLQGHRNTLKSLSLANVQITYGSWVSWFRNVRETMALEHVDIAEPLCEPKKSILLRFGDRRVDDGYAWTIKRRVWQDAEFGLNLGLICSVNTPLDSTLRSATLATLERCFTLEKTSYWSLRERCLFRAGCLCGHKGALGN